ncbi:MAG: hypothetical protein K6B40_07210, partial [Firmicutes bacterium]|nr:hypothetical protein [Bacillota bacterium]
MKKSLSLVLCLCCLLFLAACQGQHDDRAAQIRLNIQTYAAGQNQPTHPSVLAFDQPWHGYRFWLAYTPFPYADGEEENPCLAASNDLYYWETPPGLANPIAFNEETGCSELKDVNLLYREDLDRLEMWYLGRLSPDLGGDGETLLLLRKCSADGIKWSDYEVMAPTQYLCPTIVWEDGIYRMWQMQYEQLGNGGTLVYQESADGSNWSDIQKCTITGMDHGIKLWHGAVRHMNGRYYFVFIRDYLQSDAIYCCTSDDGLNFDLPLVIVGPDSAWYSYYRPDVVKVDGHYYLFYGVITHQQERYLAMSHGDRLVTMEGTKKEEREKMLPLPDDAGYGYSPAAAIRTLWTRLSLYLHWRMAALLCLAAAVAGLLLRR